MSCDLMTEPWRCMRAALHNTASAPMLEGTKLDGMLMHKATDNDRAVTDRQSK